QRRGGLSVRADGHPHVGLGDLRESLQLVAHRVVARGKVQETILTASIRGLGLWGADPRNRDRNAGESSPLLIRHVTENVACQLLRQERAAEGEERQADNGNGERVPRGAISHGHQPPSLKVSLWDG